MPCYFPMYLSETGKMCQSQQYMEWQSEMVPYLAPSQMFRKRMRSERNGDDICRIIEPWNVHLHSEVPKEKKKSSRIRKKSQCKSITHGYCKYFLENCFIFS